MSLYAVLFKIMLSWPRKLSIMFWNTHNVFSHFSIVGHYVSCFEYELNTSSAFWNFALAFFVQLTSSVPINWQSPTKLYKQSLPFPFESSGRSNFVEGVVTSSWAFHVQQQLKKKANCVLNFVTESTGGFPTALSFTFGAIKKWYMEWNVFPRSYLPAFLLAQVHQRCRCV